MSHYAIQQQQQQERQQQQKRQQQQRCRNSSDAITSGFFAIYERKTRQIGGKLVLNKIFKNRTFLSDIFQKVR
jgi:regulator of sigma D